MFNVVVPRSKYERWTNKAWQYVTGLQYLTSKKSANTSASCSNRQNDQDGEHTALFNVNQSVIKLKDNDPLRNERQISR